MCSDCHLLTPAVRKRTTACLLVCYYYVAGAGFHIFIHSFLVLMLGGKY
jgi:hypothetical protein